MLEVHQKLCFRRTRVSRRCAGADDGGSSATRQHNAQNGKRLSAGTAPQTGTGARSRFFAAAGRWSAAATITTTSRATSAKTRCSARPVTTSSSATAAATGSSGRGGNDVLLGGDADDYLEGGAGHDELYGQAGRDALFGLTGNDRLFADDGAADTVRGGPGDDSGNVDVLDDVLTVEAIS
jgi:hypothetical protein